jgi:hypothetical protein
MNMRSPAQTKTQPTFTPVQTDYYNINVPVVRSPILDFFHDWVEPRPIFKSLPVSIIGETQHLLQ